MLEMTRCSNCEYDYDQCDDCIAKDKAEEEARLYWCPQSIEHGNQTESSKCRLKYESTKVDSCAVCGYKFIYP